METNIQKETTNTDYPLLGVSGLGGWLILVHIGMYSTILMLLIQINSLPAYNAENWGALTSSQSEYYHPLWAPVIIYETVFNIALLLFTIYILVNFYRKKMILPKLMIIFYSASLISGIIDYAMLYQIPLAREVEDGSTLRSIFKSAVICAIWIPYFLKSDRVHNTFRK